MKPKTSLISLLTVTLLLGALFIGPAQAATKARPNIIIILADDMGFSDISCYGSEIPTPNIDALAKNGLRFTQFYNTGRCCPTRASLLTGLYPHQAGIGHMNEDKGLPGYRGFLNDRCITIGDVMRTAGYFTAVSGKWHVGSKDKAMWPLQRGFDRFYGVPEGGGFYFKVKEGRTVALDNEALYTVDKQTPEGWYSTDEWTKWGIKFIDEALTAKKPFFLYLAHNAPHFPLQAPPEDIAKFRGKYKMGWDKLREERYKRQVKLGIIDKAWALSPRPDAVKAWDSLSEAEKDRFDQIMSVYAACVWHMDKKIGELVSALKKRGVLDNTLIFFLSDNGGNAESGPNGRLTGTNPGSADSSLFCGQSWATLENTPFRRYKHFNHEGGIATPLIVQWPDGFKGRNEWREQPGHLIDLMATCADVGGAKYPTEVNGVPIQPMEGKSLVPAFANQPIQRDALYWEHEGNAAIRVGDWKLVRMGRPGKWELYDMTKDRTELNDLSDKYPDKVKDMLAKWDAWAKRANVKPYPSPGKKKKKGK